ncbi:MAG: helix-turn-helix domain-containing protein [Oscillospiraceae bacterium]|nr:helix-turn-helix domain-containing protein [Oscillospiraceae bacterium]
MAAEQELAEVLRDCPSLMDTKQVCAALNMNRKTVYKSIHKGELSGSIIGKGYKMTRESVNDYLNRMKKKGKVENESGNQ